MNRWMPIAAALALLAGPRIARADVPPYQPTEDACSGLDDGGACNINLDHDNPGTQGSGYADGGSGNCQGGGSCSIALSQYFSDGGYDPSGPNYVPGGTVSCVYADKCYEQAPCLQCVPGSTTGSTTSGTTSGSTSAGGSTASSTSSTTSSTTTGSTGSADGGSGSSGSSGCSSVSAVAPWFLALLIPVLVRRKKA